MRIFLPALLAIVALGAQARAAAPPPAPADTRGEAVVVIVKVPAPWYAPRWMIERKMRDAIPQYRRIPGLRFKIFSFARPGGEFGGIYLWQDRAHARDWFGPAWYARVRSERGVEPDVRMFDARPLLDNMAGLDPEAMEDAVATMVTAPIGSGDAVPALVDTRVAGLLRGHALAVGPGRDGALLLWRDESSARRALDAAWLRRQRTRRGAAPAVEWFDAPILLPSALSTDDATAARGAPEAR